LLIRLKDLRKNHNLTQEDVANILGVTRTTYSMYERGERQMDYDTLLKLADYYKVSLDYLFGRSEMPIHAENYSNDEIEFVLKSLNIYREIKVKYG